MSGNHEDTVHGSLHVWRQRLMACLTTADSDVAGEETKEALLQTLGTGMARPRGLESRPAARAGRGGGVLPDPFIHI